MSAGERLAGLLRVCGGNERRHRRQLAARDGLLGMGERQDELELALLRRTAWVSPEGLVTSRVWL